MKYDLIVIGGGSAGTSAAVEGARLGARVVVINDGPIGGTCVNVGCVPSKYLLKASETLYPPTYPGIRASTRLEDFPALMKGLMDVVLRYREEKYERVLREHGVEVIEGRAKVLSRGRVEVNGEVIEGNAVIVATGSSPYVPNVKGLDSVPYLTNLNLFSLTKLPERLIVVGGGYVGVEMAQAFRRFGSEVVLIHRGDRLLSHEDRDVSGEIEAFLSDEGVEMVKGASPVAVRGREGDIEVRLDKGGTVKGSHVLFATGRVGNTEGLGLETLGVRIQERGFVLTNGRMETGVAGVYAVGDVKGRPMYVYAAAREGKVAALNALTGVGMNIDYRAFPFVIFTDPQISGVGPTEEQLKRLGIHYERTVLPAKDVPVEGVVPGGRGFIKVLRDGEGKVLSLRAVMRNAGEVVMISSLFIYKGLKVKDLTDLFFPYLTYNEGVRLAALSFDRSVDDMSCCAG